ncbi:MAG TPA: AAA family ATPase [Terriglobales bacterium]|nr:AAA family ATPase [Terriglobales bacterium]
MSVEAIQLRNFRGFKEVSLQLKPLTVLLGPNSSGKSSFGHALAAAAHCQRRDAGSQRPTLTPVNDSDEWPVDLGTLQTLRTEGESGRAYIGLQTQSGFVEMGFGDLESEPSSLILSYLSHPFSVSSDRSDVMTIDNAPVSKNITVTRDKHNESTWWDEATQQQAAVVLDGLLVRSMQHFSATYFRPGKVQEELRHSLANLSYLRGTRKRPARGYEVRTGRWQPIGYAGEWTPTMLHGRKTDPVSYRNPPPVPTRVDQAKEFLDQSWKPDSRELSQAVAFWLVQLGLAEAIETVLSDDKQFVRVLVTLPGQRPHNLSDVGFGVSQVLPVLTAGLMQAPGSLFVVDLPEAHLHPAPQARLADFFCSMALSGQNVLVETHSEMLFNWLRLRAEQNEELSKQIAVYFIDRPSRDGRCAKPELVGLTGNAQLRWPVGFFEEAWDIESRTKMIRDARSFTAK